jgi:thermitase
MAEKAWSTSHGSSSVKIAILDDGVGPAHPDLKAKLDPGFDRLNNTTQVTPPSGDSHGTEVAGVAAAATDNSLGIAGLAPDVRLIAIRMQSAVDAVDNSQQLLYTSNAFDKAIELGADVLNCRWTLDVLSEDVNSAISAAATQGRHGLGAVIVFAAGDDGRDVAI